MKIVLPCFIVLLAIFLPASLPAGEAKPVTCFKITQQEHAYQYYHAGNENILLYDLLADTSDDETSDSERKKLSSGKSLFQPSSFHPKHFSVNNIKRDLSGTFLIILRTSLSVFISVFRL